MEGRRDKGRGRGKGGEVNELAGKYLGHTYLAELEVASAAYLARGEWMCKRVAAAPVQGPE